MFFTAGCLMVSVQGLSFPIALSRIIRAKQWSRKTGHVAWTGSRAFARAGRRCLYSSFHLSRKCSISWPGFSVMAHCILRRIIYAQLFVLIEVLSVKNKISTVAALKVIEPFWVATMTRWSERARPSLADLTVCMCSPRHNHHQSWRISLR